MFNGYRLFNMRVFFEAEDGSMRPGKNGLAFKVDKLEEFAEAVTNGLMTGEVERLPEMSARLAIPAILQKASYLVPFRNRLWSKPPNGWSTRRSDKSRSTIPQLRERFGLSPRLPARRSAKPI